MYDPAVIKEYADRLYDRAATLVVASMLLGAAAGATVLGAWLRGGFEAVIGFGIGGGLGFIIGKSMTFGMKLRAQLALCQVQIEQNTRATAEMLRQAGQPKASNSNAERAA